MFGAKLFEVGEDLSRSQAVRRRGENELNLINVQNDVLEDGLRGRKKAALDAARVQHGKTLRK